MRVEITNRQSKESLETCLYDILQNIIVCVNLYIRLRIQQTPVYENKNKKKYLIHYGTNQYQPKKLNKE